MPRTDPTSTENAACKVAEAPESKADAVGEPDPLTGTMATIGFGLGAIVIVG